MGKKLVFCLLTTLVLALNVHGAELDLLDDKPEHVIGVDIDGDYYTVIIERGKIQKIELDGLEETDFSIETTRSSIYDLIVKFPSLSKIELIRYINENFNLPLDMMMTLAGGYMKNG